MKHAGAQKSGISLFAHVREQCVLYQRTRFVSIYCNVLNGNQAVRLKDLPMNLFRQTDVQADFKLFHRLI